MDANVESAAKRRASPLPRQIKQPVATACAARRPRRALVLGLIVSLLSATSAAAADATSTFETIVETVVIKPGKAVARAAKSAADNIESAGNPKAAKARAAKGPKSKDGKEAQRTQKTKKKDVIGKSAGGSDVPVTEPKMKSAAVFELRNLKASNAQAGKTAATPAFPVTLDEAKAAAEAANAPPPAWTPEEIADAKERCAAIFKRITAVAIPEPPIRQGSCGAPAPIQLVSIGKSPEVAISPPATMTCELAEALDTWMSKDVQPLARKHLGADIIKIENMSSYACRNAYGRVGGKLSEHGLANALDIRGFVTSSAKTAYLLEDWGVTQREINAKIAAEKSAAEKADAARMAAEKAAQDNQKTDKSAPSADPPGAAASSTAGAPAGGIARGTVVEGVPKLTVTIPGAKSNAADPALGLTEPSRLGAAKPDQTKKAAPTLVKKTGGVQITVGIPLSSPPSTAKGEFLRQTHAAACRIFGTTLGPEANAAHRNHFHVDMAPRKRTKICD
jgi:hypothetical protein